MSDLALLQEVLAKPLAEVADLPDYVVPAPGTYRLLVAKVESRTIGDKPAVAVDYAILGCIELADKEDKPTEPGALTGEAFFFADPNKIEQSLSVIKARFGALAESLGVTDVLGLLNKIENLEIQATIGNRVDKNDKTKLYPSFKNITLAS